MASVTGVVLNITPNPADVNKLNVGVTFTIQFNDFDRASRLSYLECIRIVGVDKLPGEDNTDDVVVDPLSSTNIVAPAGGASLNRAVLVPVQRNQLDEDKPPVPNPDELQARITLTPLLPQELTANSNIERIDLP